MKPYFSVESIDKDFNIIEIKRCKSYKEAEEFVKNIEKLEEQNKIKYVITHHTNECTTFFSPSSESWSWSCKSQFKLIDFLGGVKSG